MRFEESYLIFAHHLTTYKYLKRTKRDYLREVYNFFEYVKETEGITDVREVHRDVIQDYAEHLKSILMKDGNHYSSHTRNVKITALKNFFNCMYLNEKIIKNPAEGIVVLEKRLKLKAILSKEEICALLDRIDTGSLKGLRNRAIFELIYSSGLRVSEVSNLKAVDVDLNGRYVMIRGGKFGKDRLVPISKVAFKFMKKYGGGRGCYFFEGDYGGRVSVNTIGRTFRLLLLKYGYGGKGISVHSLRHMMATHLLEGGAGVRYVQEMLGHESIETTVKYTHMMKSNMKRLYKEHHPRENGLFCEVDEEYLNRLNKYFNYPRRKIKDK